MSRSGSAKGETSQLLGDLFHLEIDWAALLRAVQGPVRTAVDARVPDARLPDEGLAGDDGGAAAFLTALIGRIEEAGQAILEDSAASGGEVESPEADEPLAEAAEGEEEAAEVSATDDSTEPAEALPFTDPELAAMFESLQAQLPEVRAMIDAAVLRVFPAASGHSGQAPGIFAGDSSEGSAPLFAGLPVPHIFPPAVPVDLGG